MVIHFHYYCCISSVRNFPLHPFFIVLLMCTYGDEYFVVVWPKSKFHWFSFWNIPHFALFHRLPAFQHASMHGFRNIPTFMFCFILFCFNHFRRFIIWSSFLLFGSFGKFILKIFCKSRIPLYIPQYRTCICL